MPKKTRLQKLKNQQKNTEGFSSATTLAKDDSFFVIDSAFRKDLVKSVLFAITITGFEIALYFIYYQRLFERR
jgi:hypothetical protein